MKTLRMVLAVVGLALVLALALLLLSQRLAPAAGGGGVIKVAGSGQAEALPDMVSFTVGVRARADTAAAAQAEAARAMAPVMARLLAEGIGADEIQTQSLVVRPVASGLFALPNPPQEARSIVRVRSRLTPGLGQLLADLGAAGANDFGTPGFYLEDTGLLLDTARRAAVKEALDKAAVLAEAAGMRVGAVLLLQDGDVNYLGAGGDAMPLVVGESDDASLPPVVPVSPGVVSRSASVVMEFSLIR